jgi:hypothetical protein
MNHAGLELGEGKPINGFPRVAAKIAHDRDKTTTIYRRFDRLSARNLLFLQAELAELEALQDSYDSADLNTTDQAIIDGHSDWAEFERYAKETDNNGHPVRPEEKKKMDLALKIRTRLKEYRKRAIPLLSRLFD